MPPTRLTCLFFSVEGENNKMKIIVKGNEYYLNKIREEFFDIILPAETEETRKIMEEYGPEDVKIGYSCYEQNARIKDGVLTIVLNKKDWNATGAFLAKRFSAYICDEVLYEDKEPGETDLLYFDDGKLIKSEKIFKNEFYALGNIKRDENGVLKVEKIYHTA